MDPKRWIDADAPPRVREILRAARPTPPMNEPLRGRLSQYVAKTVSLSGASGWSWAGAKGIATIGLVVVAGYGVTKIPHRKVGAAKAAPLHEVAARPVATDPPAPTAEPPVDQPASPAVDEPAPPRTERPVSAAAPRFGSKTLDEVDYIEHARALLAADPREALRLADAHRATYPRGRLGPEADVVAVHGLERLGQREAARARAKATLARYPDTIYAESLRRLLDSTR
jgi:hypothetical protein